MLEFDTKAILSDPRARERLIEDFPREDYEQMVLNEGQAAADAWLEDSAHDAVGNNMVSVLTLGWDGNFPGNSGVVHVYLWEGLYFVGGSDYSTSGPYADLDEALDVEYFYVETSRPTLSGDIPDEKLLEVAQRVCGEDSTIYVNDVAYGWRDGKFVEVDDAGEAES